jgi:hypothetical protein
MDLVANLSRILARMKIELPTDRPPSFVNNVERQRFPRGGLHLVLTGRSSEKPQKRGLPIVCKEATTLNLGRTYRGDRNADARPDGRSATRRRRQMEARA